MTYDWQAGLVFFFLVVVLTKIGKFLLFKVPALAECKAENRAEDKLKLKKDKYRPVIKSGQRVGLVANLLFFIGIAPWFVTLAAQPVSKVVIDILVIMMVYDFFYYLTHRFLFHGQGYFRRVHALHHQARNPTYVDSHYVHPLETAIGLALFIGTIPVVGFFMGPFSFITMTVCTIIFFQLNQINHCKIDIPRFPYKTLSWISKKHAAHHIDMQHGNYATITLLYDKMFGTFE